MARTNLRQSGSTNIRAHTQAHTQSPRQSNHSKRKRGPSRQREGAEEDEVDAEGIQADAEEQHVDAQEIQADVDEQSNLDSEEHQEEGDEEGADSNERKRQEGENTQTQLQLPPAKNGDIEPTVKRRKKELYALPNREEQVALRETENLFHTNIVRLQVDELLLEVRENYEKKSVRGAERFLFALKAFLESLDDCALDSNTYSAVPEGEMMPLRCYPSASSASPVIKLQFKAPTAVDVVGAFMHKVIVKPHRTIDVVVEMPAECFDTKDILNHVYFDKRKLYLQHLIAQLNKSVNLVTSVKCALYLGDTRKPVLVLCPADQYSTKYTVRILPALASDVFKLTQLLPTKNNVRPLSWMAVLQAEHQSRKQSTPNTQRKLPTNIIAHSSLDHSTLIGTPHYNMCILEDCSFRSHMELLWGCSLQGATALGDALVLLQVWLAQRELHRASDSLDFYGTSTLLAYLVQSRVVSGRASALQVLQAAFQFLASTDLCAEPRVLHKTHASRAQAYQEHFDAVLVDTSGSYNSLWRLSSDAAAELRREAQHTLDLLSRTSTAPDEAVAEAFLRRRRFWQRYDAFVHVPITGLKELDEPGAHDRGAIKWIARESTRVLRESLGARLKALRGTVLCDDKAEAAEEWVVVGLALDMEEARRLVDKGPPADDAQAAQQFREFWGPKAELRRFKDGRILETVVWGQSGQSSAETLEKIVRYALGRHLGVVCGPSGEALQLCLQEVEGVLPSVACAQHDALTRDALMALDELRKVMQELTGAPLRVNDVAPSSPLLRYTALFAALQHPLVEGTREALKAAAGQERSHVIPTVDVHLLLESSSRWPSDPEALRHTVTAMLLKIGECLQHSLSVHTVATRTHLDIFFRGYIFRARISFPQASSTHTDQNPATDCRPSANVEALHHSLIHSTHARNNALGPCVRLLQRWLASHMLSGHVPLEALELLAAYVCLKGEGAPATGQSAFLRCLLLLAEYDWGGAPLAVNLGPELDTGAIHLAFDAERARNTSTHQRMYNMFISAPYDKQRGWRPSWTARHPEAPVLRRITAVAAQSAQCLLRWLQKHETQTWQAAFGEPQTALRGVADCALRVSRHVCMPGMRSLDGGALQELWMKGPAFARLRLFTNLSSTERGTAGLLSGLQPVKEFVETLSLQFGREAVFFYDELAAEVIGIAWRPNIKSARTQPSNLTVLECKHVAPAEGHLPGRSEGVVWNESQVIAEMVATSLGLVVETISASTSANGESRGESNSR